MGRHNLTREIAEGGLLVSLAFIFYFAGLTFSVIDILKYLSVTPIIIGVVKYGVKRGSQITLASGLLIGILFGFFSGIEFFLSAGLIGLILGICLDKNYSAFKTILYTFFAAFVGFTAVTLMYMFILGMDISLEFKTLADWLKTLVADMSASDGIRNYIAFLTTFFGLNKNWTDMQWITRMFIDLMPSLLIFISFYYVIYIWVFNVFIIKRLRIELKSNASLGEIPVFLLIPTWSISFLFGGIILFFINIAVKSRIIEVISLNLMFIMLMVCFAKGVFLINTFVRTKIPDNKNTRLLTGFIITLLEFTIFSPLVIMAGILSIVLKSQNMALHEYLAVNYLKNGRFEQAIIHLKKALEFNPCRPHLHQLIAIAYEKTSQKDLGSIHLKKFLELTGSRKLRHVTGNRF